jgi:WD40 repeat protein/peptidoglycan hydrolase CwlO-like protein
MTPPPSPYKGLSSFEDSELDALFFFGREREREIIAANLMASSLTVLYGETGVGKSSVLRAGVVRDLRALPERLEVVVFDDWQDDPAAALRSQLAHAAGQEPADSLAETLERCATLADAEIFVVLDGLEEYFLYHGSGDEPDGFLEDFAEAVAWPGLRAGFLLSIREDSLAKLDRFKARIPNVLGNYLRLDHLDRDSAREAIVGPVDRYNELSSNGAVEVEPALVEAVLDQVAAGKVELGESGRGGVEPNAAGGRIEAPFLQLVMARLWQAERAAGSPTLRMQTLVELGGAEQIVRDHLDRALGRLSPEQQDLAASVFNQLVTPSGTKIAHDAADLAGYVGVDEAELEPVLATLAAERILRPVPGVPGSDRPRYEIFHDILADAVLAWRTRHETSRTLARVREAAAKRHRRLLVIAVAAILLAGAMAGVTVFAFTQRSEAERQAALAKKSLRTAVEAKQALRTTNSELKQKNRELRGLNAQLDSLNRQLKSKNAQLASLNAQLESKNAELASLNAQLESKNAELASLNAQLESKNAELASLNAQLKSKNAQLASLNAQLKSKNAELASLNVQLDSLNAQLKSKNTQLNSKNIQLSSARNRADQKAKEALARADAAAALAEVSTAPEQALNDALQSAELEPAGAESVLRTALNSSRVQAILPGAGTPTAALAGGGSAFTTRGALPTGGAGGGRSVQTREISGNETVLALGDRSGVRLYRLPSGTLIRKLDVGAPVTHVALTGDGRLLAAASPNGFVSVLDVATGRRVYPPLSHGGRPVQSLAFSHDGKLLATASNDKKVRIWDSSTGRLALPPILHPRAVTLVSFSPDDRLLLTVDGANARLLDTATGQVRATMTQQDPIRTAAFSPDGKLVATGSTGTGATAQLWAVPTGTAVGKPLTGHRGDILSESFSSDGKLLVTASADGTARVWSVPQGIFVAWLVGHGNQVRSAAFSPDAKWIVTASRDGTARVWETGTGSWKTTLAGVHGALTSAFFTPDGRWVVTTSDDGTARIWDPGTAPELKRLGAHSRSVSRVSISPNGKLALSAASDGVVKVLPVNGGPATTFELGGTVTTASWSNDGKLILAAGDKGIARVWRLSDGRPVAIFNHGAPIRGAAFNRDSTRVVTAGADGVARVWKMAGRAPLEVLHQGAAVTNVVFSPDGSLVATVGENRLVRLWSAADGRRVRTFRGHFGAIVALAFSPDGNWLATASADSTARIWNLHGRDMKVLRHPKPLTSLAFSPNSELLATASVNHDAFIWGVAGGRPKILSGHAATVTDVKFSFDGRWIVTAGATTAGLWNVSDGSRLSFLHGSGAPPAPLTSVAFSPSGWRVVTGSKDGTVATYDCRLCGGVTQLIGMAKARLADLGRDLNADQRKKYLGT